MRRPSNTGKKRSGLPSKKSAEGGQDHSVLRPVGLLSVTPMVVRTYAPVGKTPILKENLTRDHLSAMSGITLEGKLYMIEQENVPSKEKMWCAS